ncbi:MAG: hypothetical protein H6746_18845 [Deltaproteobacteria bacterium]|nr:hypothetical protein [Deltaproteobacteria bacterium]
MAALIGACSDSTTTFSVSPPGPDSVTAAASLTAGLAELGASRPQTALPHMIAARQSDPRSAEAALALGLTRFLLLAEDPAATDALAYLGRPPLRTWVALGAGGVFAQLATGSDCGLAMDSMLGGMPWTDIGSLPDFMQAIPPGVNGDVLVDKLDGLIPALDAIIADLAAARDGGPVRLRVPGSLIYIDGTLDLGEAEAALLSGVAGMVKGALLLLGAYDWAFSPREHLGTSRSATQRVAEFNDHFLVLRQDRGRARALAARDAFVKAASDLVDGLDAGLVAQGTSAQAPLAWGQVKPVVLERYRDITKAFRDGLTQVVALPFLSPPTNMDIGQLFTNPFDARASEFDPMDVESETWTWDGVTYTDYYWSWVEGFFQDTVRGRFQPNIYQDPDARTWKVQWYRWEDIRPLFEPLLDRLARAHSGCSW